VGELYVDSLGQLFLGTTGTTAGTPGAGAKAGAQS
jgi:hypothetical protein